MTTYAYKAMTFQTQDDVQKLTSVSVIKNNLRSVILVCAAVLKSLQFSSESGALCTEYPQVCAKCAVSSPVRASEPIRFNLSDKTCLNVCLNDICRCISKQQ